jgi:K(+)-stimulated pyrophosphate-energized sodium pump
MLPDFVIPVLGVIGIGFALLTYASVLRHDAGTDRMRRIAEQIHMGAMVFLRREYGFIVIFVVIVAVILGISLAPGTAAAYLAGAACSMTAGYLGMEAATRQAAEPPKPRAQVELPPRSISPSAAAR